MSLAGLDRSAGETFFRSMRQGFDLATGAGCRSRRISLAGQPLELRLAAGAGAAAAERYLSALAAGPAPAERLGIDRDLTVAIWETAGTGVPPPAPDWRPEDHVVRGELPRFSDDRFKAAYNIQSRVLSAIDLQDRVAIHCVRSFAELPQYELGAPLRDVLGWWLTSRRLQLVHAAAVAAGGRGALLAGPGGSGKSTTAAQCLGHEALSFVADDYCAVSLQGGAPYVHALFRTSKLDLRAAEANAGLGQGEFSDETGKFLFHLRPETITGGAALHSVLLPEIVDAELSDLTPVGQGEAIRRLAPSTLLQLPGSGRRELTLMAELVRRVPAFRLRLGRDRDQLLGLVGGHLRAVG
jgi:hypothetical protein